MDVGFAGEGKGELQEPRLNVRRGGEVCCGQTKRDETWLRLSPSPLGKKERERWASFTPSPPGPKKEMSLQRAGPWGGGGKKKRRAQKLFSPFPEKKKGGKG